MGAVAAMEPEAGIRRHSTMMLIFGLTRIILRVATRAIWIRAPIRLTAATAVTLTRPQEWSRLTRKKVSEISIDASDAIAPAGRKARKVGNGSKSKDRSDQWLYKNLSRCPRNRTKAFTRSASNEELESGYWDRRAAMRLEEKRPQGGQSTDRFTAGR